MPGKPGRRVSELTRGKFEEFIKSRISVIIQKNLIQKIIHVTELMGQLKIELGMPGHIFSFVDRYESKINFVVIQEPDKNYTVSVSVNGKKVFCAMELIVLEKELNRLDNLRLAILPDHSTFFIDTYIPGSWERFTDPISIEKLVSEERIFSEKKTEAFFLNSPIVKKERSILKKFGSGF